MSNGIQPGDAVQLKSGSPTMTVDSLYEGGKNEQRAVCVWFVDEKEQKANFSVTSLLKVG